MPQQTSTFEACSWVPILQVDGLGKVWVNCFPKAIATQHGQESNPRPPDLESDGLPNNYTLANLIAAKLIEKETEKGMSILEACTNGSEYD
ncbi:hypothetical protein ElyMa_005967100 [Elysia marginata]|uniref:Uncharacterized protein n=1 Tax=Elysia marginata TaxID=1093978 RepID=A0AAV4GEL9_9GAST|nr:hypothetical protein ElyMa_005967100 [Elysia marginata]